MNERSNCELSIRMVPESPGTERHYVLTASSSFIKDSIELAAFLKEHYVSLDRYILDVPPERLAELIDRLQSASENTNNSGIVLSIQQNIDLRRIYSYRRHYKDPVLDDFYDRNPNITKNSDFLQKRWCQKGPSLESIKKGWRKKYENRD